MLNRNMWSLLLLVIVLLGLTGCMQKTYHSVVQKYAVLQSKNLKIVAEKENWSLEYGKPQMPPKFWHSTKTVEGQRLIAGGGPIADGLTPDYDSWLKSDYGKSILDVKIYLNGESKPLYGKMLFVTAREDMLDTSAVRAWTVDVPSQYIEVAQRGQVAVVYQPAKVATSKYDMATWVLWLSSLPL